MFKRVFPIKNIWDGVLVFTQKTIYHVRTEMRRSLDTMEITFTGR